MDRAAVFVDAGYLFAQGSLLIAGEKLARSELHLDHDKVLASLSLLAANITSLPLLRIYWYDGTASGPTPTQLALAYKPSVKLRLGFVNQHGQQKGVDSLIVTDLINLARNRAMADAVLLTGDEDIRVGVQQAQEFGVRVHLIGIEPARDNQSGNLVQEADSCHELRKTDVTSFLTRVAPRTVTASVAPNASATGAKAPLVAIAERLAAQLSDDEVRAILKESHGGSVPSEIDRRLLVEGTNQTGALLVPDEKRLMREAFISACRSRQ